MTKAVHVAGPMGPLVQRCVRCGAILTDWTNAMVPESDKNKPLGGWAEGAHVEVQHHEWFGSSTLTNDAPTCVPGGE